MARKKKEETEVSNEVTKRDIIAKIIGDVKKKYGTGSISFADDYDGSNLFRRPTGILSLDIALKGGWPAGKLIEVLGPEGAGKTTLLAETCKQIQLIYGEDACIGLAMIEPWDKAYWKNLGVRVAFSDGEIKQAEEARGTKFTVDEIAYLKDQVGIIVHEKASTAEDMLGIGWELTKTGHFQLMGYDSIGALQKKEQQENNVGDKVYAGASGAITDFVNKTLQVNNQTTTFLINQLRQNLNKKTPYDKEFIIPGGQALKYVKAVSVLLKKGEKIKRKINDKEVVIGRYTNWLIEKGKCGIGEGAAGSYASYKEDYGYPMGIDKEDDIASTGLFFDVITKEGMSFIYNGNILAKKFDDLAEYLRHAPEIRDEIAKECIKRSGIQYVVK